MKPHVAINLACSLDGKIASKGGKAFKFSNFEDLARVHKMRSESDIILVGKNTINSDDPKLIVNEKYYQSDHIPDAAILDSNLTVNLNSRVFAYQRDVVMFCGNGAHQDNFAGNFKSKVIIRKSHDQSPSSDFVIQELGKLGYRKIMIEGGKSVITSFVKDGNWDELTIFYSPILIGEEGVTMFGSLDEPLKLGSAVMSRLGDGFLLKIKKRF
jgi:riboflavin-specific deaminase-like protein